MEKETHRTHFLISGDLIRSERRKKTGKMTNKKRATDRTEPVETGIISRANE